MKLKIRIISVSVVLIILFVLFVIASIHDSKYNLEVSHYQISTSEITEGIRIVQLSDQHNSVFGEDNEMLINQVREQMPDLIFITGDILNANEKGTDIAESTIKLLTEIAPVYISMGNHELQYEAAYGTDIKELFERCGATVLDYSYVDVDVKGQHLRIGGIYSYCVPVEYLEGVESRLWDALFLDQFQNTDRYTILLCHLPLCWIRTGGLNSWDVDLVFSGHVHGGQVIFPVIGGAFAPDFGSVAGKT